MNAEALIGKVLGSCTLQELIGQGGMGAVYLAQQSRPRRQVAVKVLMPLTPLAPHQLAAFLERFRRETDAAASLEHPNIVPVHEYGEQEGIAYLVMPYIAGGTLRDEMEREGPLSFSMIVRHLEELASALDFAHERGVIHRDIKPANILLTPTGRLLLTDFGLVKVAVDGPTPQIRLTGAGAPVGTPDYMAPEQVIGEGVDGRADQYSLGVILYQMVTGTTPFQGETPMQIAARHLRTPPPSPRSLRSDLPAAAEQVILRALAKRPTDRYAQAQEMALAFRAALEASGISLSNLSLTTHSLQAVNSGTGQTRAYRPRGLFDPSWKTGVMPVAGTAAKATETVQPAARVEELVEPAATGTLPAARASGLLSRTGMFPRVGVTGHVPAATAGSINAVQQPTGMSPIAATPQAGSGLLSAHKAKLPPTTGGQPAVVPVTGSPTGVLPTATGGQPAVLSPLTQLSPVLKTSTGSLIATNGEQSTSNTVKLTGPVKVVQVPVAGQPGRFVTGLLPVVQVPKTDGGTETAGKDKGRKKPWVAVVTLFLLLAILGSGTFWYVHIRPTTTRNMSPTSTGTAVPAGTPNPAATATAQAVATADANILLSDPLSTNIHGWPTNNDEFFKGGAYHIVDTVGNGIAVVLAEKPFCQAMGYSLTMNEVKGDDASVNNSTGMILRFSQKTVGNRKVTTFYSFEVVNTKGGQYRFYKYDDSKGASSSDWTLLWHQNFGNEFHQGQGTKNTNTLKVYMNGKNFTFIVNGKKVGTFQDGSLTCGTVGMLVNLKGTEMAFSNLLITRN